VDGGTIVGASIAVGSVGPRPVRATAAAGLLVGKPAADTEALAEAAALAAEASNAVEDANGSVEYKEQLVRVLCARCVAAAVGAAGVR
jgi:carbon-monoxide dehydrogenase medium subunit